MTALGVAANVRRTSLVNNYPWNYGVTFQ